MSEGWDGAFTSREPDSYPILKAAMPGTLEERLRKSFENLAVTADTDSETEADPDVVQDMGDEMPEDLPPADYGDDQDQADSPGLQMRPLGGWAADTVQGHKVKDISVLSDLTEESVLRVIQERYLQDKIYTSCGDVLISVNPFKQLGIFDEDAHERYGMDSLADGEDEPHVYRVACQAIVRRSRERSNQVVLVSGESGAGKTEATKLMLKHILHLSVSKQDKLFTSIDKVNPLLELFGNARTLLNGNSSRFAKFLDVRFSADGQVTGAIIRDYILEKTRVVSPTDGESNFHIFYTFLDDVMSSPARQKQFLMEGMDKMKDFRIVPRKSWLNSPSRMSQAEQAKVFRMIGIPQEDVDNIHTMLAAILHLTNIQFVDDEQSSAGAVVVYNEDTMMKAAALMGLKPEKLALALVTEKMAAGGERISTFKSQTKAEETRDAIAKALYERVFGWLIRRINGTINKTPTTEAGIGFLDICGFEDLNHNSMEQMCINLANENLQSFMNNQVFVSEMKIFMDQGIDLGRANPPSNEPILKMFNAQKTGIIALINEDSRFGLSTDHSLVQKLNNNHAHGPEGHFFTKKTSDPIFGIRHFAAMVWYDARNFLEKNGDLLSQEVKDTLVGSSNELLSDIFIVSRSATGSISPTNFNYRVSQKHNIMYQRPGPMKLSESIVNDLRQSLKTKFGDKIPRHEGSQRSQADTQRTVLDYFQESMSDLIRKMKEGKPLFVRCIKPNDRQEPSRFDEGKVRAQLRYNGVAEIARIRRVWFPIRVPLSDFIKRYCLVAAESKTIPDIHKAVAVIVQKHGFDSSLYKLGRDMIFMKDEVPARLDKILEAAEAAEKLRKQQEEAAKREAERKEDERKANEKKRELEQKKMDLAVSKRVAEEAEDENEEETIVTIEHEPKPVLRAKLSDAGPVQRSSSGLKDIISLSTIQEINTPMSSVKSTAFLLPHSTSTSETSLQDNSAHSSDSEDTEPNRTFGVPRPPTPPSVISTPAPTRASPLPKVKIEKEKEEPAAPEKKEINMDDGKKHFWDIFRVVTREQPTTDIHQLRAMKAIKFFVYIFLFLIVLICATTQKVSLMLMVKAAKTPESLADTKTKNRAAANYVLLIVAVCIPYGLKFLSCVGKVLFGNFKSPSAGTWIWVFVVESLHSFGMCLLVFRVLPRQSNVVEGLFLLNAVAFIPSILKPVTSQEVNARRYDCSFFVSMFVDILAFIGQGSAFILIYMVNYVKDETGDVAWVGKIDAMGAVLFVSLYSWENFMDGRCFRKLGDMNPLKNFMLKRRFDLERGRYKVEVVMNLWKVAVTVVLAYFFRGGLNFDYKSALTALGQDTFKWKMYSSIIVLTLSAVVCYYMTYIACKLWMQRLSFSVPLCLATPCSILLFYLDDAYNFLGYVVDSSNSKYWPDVEQEWKTFIVGLAWWVSLLLLVRHIWFPRQSRLAKYEIMFTNMLYCGILTAEALMLNRRRHTRTCHKAKNAIDKVYYKLSKTEKKASDDGVYATSSETYARINDVNMSSNTLDSEAGYESYRDLQKKKMDEEVPTIYACATMWHEVRREMIALLKSLHRIDLEQWTRRQAQEISGTKDKDYFEYEAHIFFDDAMVLNDDEEIVPNEYVTLLVEIIEEAVSSVHKKTMTVDPPIKIPTPYGGRLMWVMPGGNMLFVHVKDKTKIRHRKRWSQVMYMYYLLGFRLTRFCSQEVMTALASGNFDHNAGWNISTDGEVHGSDIFKMLDESVAKKAQNTFVMALDGDTDFHPGSVHILLDRMKKNPKVGAACGRIHPIGSGPMVWYQMFEYAIGHWMQKSTEHVLGCVLCSPGCFSLFRGSALMDDNVMKMYTIMPSEPGHYLQYDQGEDRWLCTLLLQQGYRVDYAAAADAWTYAPEGFNEFFNQRRRWMPSTLANVLDLLSDYKNTVSVNSNISMLYIVYQVALMLATLIGPGTVLMMIAGAVQVVFDVDLIWAYVISVVPGIIFTFVCLKCKTNIQLYLAAIMSTFYAFVMMIVFVGTLVQAADKGLWDPSVIVMTILILIFIIAAAAHPMEFTCLFSAPLYLLVIPSGYLLLVIYSLCNLHVVSWGTRETPKKKTKAEMAQDEEDKKKKEEENKKKKGIFSGLFFSSYLNDMKDLVQSLAFSKNAAAPQGDDKTVQLLAEINENIKKLSEDKTEQEKAPVVELEAVTVETPDCPVPEKKKKKAVTIAEPEPEIPEKVARDDLVNPRWIEEKGLGDGPILQLYDEELEFWQIFIGRYLKPLDGDKQKEEEMGKQLLELRDQVVFGVSMINLLWMAINFMFQLKQPLILYLPIGPGGTDVEQDILGLSFVIFLLAILLLQIVGMIIHRWGTLLHLLAFTDLNCPCVTPKLSMRSKDEQSFNRALEFCRKLVNEPVPDYIDDEEQSPEEKMNMLAMSVKQRLEETVKGPSGLPQQSVVQHLNNLGIKTGPSLLQSRQVDLFLRASTRGVAVEEEDPEANRFLQQFRETITKRPGTVRMNGFPSHQTMNGLAPNLPRRQPSGVEGGVRRRLNANNLRYTVKDVIARVEKQSGIKITRDNLGVSTPAFRTGGGLGGGGGVGGSGVGGGRYAGSSGLDMQFSRRMKLFNDFAEQEEDTNRVRTMGSTRVRYADTPIDA